MQVRLELVRTQEPGDPFAFSGEDQAYLLRTEDGSYEQTGALPWSSPELRQAMAALARPNTPATALAPLGRALAELLAPTSWPARARALLEAAARGEALDLQVVSNAAELLHVPWELLPLPDGRRLVRLPGLRLRLSWLGAEPRPLRSTPEGRVAPELTGAGVLFAWSEAGGALPHEAHLRGLEAASAGAVPLQVLPHVRASALQAALEAADGRVAILHLLAHGAREGDAAGLALDGGVLDPLTASELLGAHADSLRLVVLSACNSSRATPGSALSGMAQSLHRAGIEAVIASSAPLSAAGSVRLCEALYDALLRGHAPVGHALEAARGALARAEPTSPDPLVLQLWASRDAVFPRVLRPYRGLEVFGPDQAALFFGREAEAQECLSDLAALRREGRPRLLVVAGASGTGKSSLVRARVLPALEAELGPATPLRPSSNAEVPTPRGSEETPRLVFVDQLEELFTHQTPEARASFARGLWALAQDEVGSVVITTLRVDFIGRCGELQLPDGFALDRVAYDEAHRVFLSRMGAAELLEAVEGPARVVGLPIEEGLAEQLVGAVVREPGALPLLEFALDELWRRRRPGEGLSHAGYQALGGGVGGVLERKADALVAGMPPEVRDAARRLLVQLVNLEASERSDTKRRRRLAELRPEPPGAFDAALAQLTGARLVVTGGAEQPWAELAHEELLRRWGQLRVWVDQDRQKWIEIAKVRSWEQLLRGAQLDRALEARERYGEDLGAPTLEHIAKSERALAEEAAVERARQAELLAAKEKAEAQRRRAQRGALLAGGLLLVALVALAGGGVFYLRLEESNAATLAEQQRSLGLQRLAEARALMAEGDLLAARHALADMDNTGVEGSWWELASEVLRGSPAPWRVLRSTSPGLRELLWTADSAGLIVGNAHTLFVETDRSSGFDYDPTWRWAADGRGTPAHLGQASRSGDSLRWLGTTGRFMAAPRRGSGAVSILSGEAGGPQTFLGRHNGPLRRVRASPDGRWIYMTASYERQAIYAVGQENPRGPLFQLGDRSPEWKRDPERVTPELRWAEFTPDSTRVVGLTTEGELWVFPLGAPDSSERPPATRLESAADPIAAFGISPDSAVVATHHASGEIMLRPLNALSDARGIGSQSAPNELYEASQAWGEPANTLRFSPTGGALITHDKGGETLVWSLFEGASTLWADPWESDLQRGLPTAFSADGAQLLSVNPRGQVHVRGQDDWRGVELEEAPQHVRQAEFSGALVLVRGQAEVKVYRPPTALPVLDSTTLPALVVARTGDAPTAAALSPDGALLAVSSSDDSVGLWRVPAVSAGPEEPLPREIPLRDDGPTLSVETNHRDNTDPDFRTFTTNNNAALGGEEERRFGGGDPEGHDQVVLSAEWSPDRNHILTGHSDGRARIWDADPREPLRVLEGHAPGSIVRARYSPSGHRVLTVSTDYTAIVHELDSGATTPLGGHGGRVIDGAFNADETHVWTLVRPDPPVKDSLERRAFLWELSSGSEVGSLRDEASVLTASFTPDGQRLVTLHSDGRLRAWTLDGELVHASPVSKTLRTAELLMHPTDPVVVSHTDDEVRLHFLDTDQASAHAASTQDLTGLRLDDEGRLLLEYEDSKTSQAWQLQVATDLAALQDALLQDVEPCLGPAQRARVFDEMEDEADAAWRACELERWGHEVPALPTSIEEL
ncbi:MAG: CHAT domain-containing protein [Alphaproteobacteria bacterium]|nr:CHAT domain-containing protein [Alphaproteobacteria bacterium]